jgi:multiple sugar transport system substrate-binding protein
VTIHDEPHVDDWFQKVQVEIAGGAPPDILFSSDDQMTSLAVRGAFVDLLPFFKADGLKKEDFWPAALNPQFLGPHLFAMPLDYGVDVLYYNKALFDKQHVQYPTDKWTWDDFVKAGRKLTVDRSGKRADEPGFQPQHVVQYAEDGGLQYFFNNVLRSNGTDWATPDLSRALLDSPAAIKTFQWIADLGNKYFVSMTPKYVASLSFAMEQGNVAMHFDGTWQFDVYPFYPVTKWNKGNIDIVPFPAGPNGHPSGAEASGLNVVAGGKPQNVKWAWEFVKFMTTTPGQRMGIKYGVDSVPNTKALAEQVVPTYQLPHNSKIILGLLPQAKLPFWCTTISNADLENIMFTPWSPTPELRAMYMGNKTAAEAMPSVNRKVQAILTKDQALAHKIGATLHL